MHGSFSFCNFLDRQSPCLDAWFTAQSVSILCELNVRHLFIILLSLTVSWVVDANMWIWCVDITTVLTNHKMCHRHHTCLFVLQMLYCTCTKIYSVIFLHCGLQQQTLKCLSPPRILFWRNVIWRKTLYTLSNSCIYSPLIIVLQTREL